MRAVIFGSAPIEDYNFVELDAQDYVICCDGGLGHAISIGIKPDLFLGDMDSVQPGQREHFGNELNIEKYPAEKDFTDMELATMRAQELGADEIVIYGGIGRRFDHTLANAQLLVKLFREGIKASLRDSNNIVQVIDHEIELNADFPFVSLLPVGELVSGITTEGLYYPLCGETLELGQSRGLSNQFSHKDGRARITLESGLLYIVQSRD